MWLSNSKYFSPDILNEQIELIANSVLRIILKEIQSAGWFCIIAEDATDVKRCEQMCICIRWVDDEYVVSEDPIVLVKVQKTDSKTLFTVLKDVCIRCMLSLEKINVGDKPTMELPTCRGIFMVLLHVSNRSKILHSMFIV